MTDNSVLNLFDNVILCTGFYHGLDIIFDKELYNKLFEQHMLNNKETKWGKVPKTKGNNQSLVDDSLYFVGLLGDVSIVVERQ